MMLYQMLLFIFCITGQLISQNIRSQYMSRIDNVKFQCISPYCSSSNVIYVRDLLHCQSICLTMTCRTMSFYQSIDQCHLFNDTPYEYGNLIAQNDVVTMVIIDNSLVVNKSTKTTTDIPISITSNELISTSTSAAVTSQESSIISMTTVQSTLPMTSSSCVNAEIFPTGRSPTMGWYFQNDLNDKFRIYNGTARNGPLSYSLGRNGCGKCVNLSYALQQSVVINQTPLIDLRSISYSIEAWIYPTRIRDGIEHVIFGQCSSLATRSCMRTSISGNAILGTLFYSDTQIGSRILSNNTWFHIASVYNLTETRVSLYINGVLDTSGTSHGPTQAVPYRLEIGNVALYSPSSNLSFNGCIDELWFYPFARTSDEIAATFALG
ncbi:unnamed protein product [Adineta ricciae]|uniref:Uncharacterized protein n=2 Tax=Adineta ricciae TaxID=249248 RepID=A0A814XFQ2_ADIRI|nr:unnamed protein product [Adineta ricciae]